LPRSDSGYGLMSPRPSLNGIAQQRRGMPTSALFSPRLVRL
jgi:hypothetical protein